MGCCSVPNHKNNCVKSSYSMSSGSTLYGVCSHGASGSRADSRVHKCGGAVFQRRLGMQQRHARQPRGGTYSSPSSRAFFLTGRGRATTSLASRSRRASACATSPSQDFGIPVVTGMSRGLKHDAILLGHSRSLADRKKTFMKAVAEPPPDVPPMQKRPILALSNSA